MWFFLIIGIVAVILILCPDNKSRKAVLGAIAAILYFPIGVILALTKKYK